MGEKPLHLMFRTRRGLVLIALSIALSAIPGCVVPIHGAAEGCTTDTECGGGPDVGPVLVSV